MGPLASRVLWAAGAVALAVYVALLSGCGAAQRTQVVQVSNVVAMTVNDLAPVLVDHYRQASTSCVIESEDRAHSMACRAKIDGDWSQVRRAWAHMRMAQADVATELEEYKPGSGTEYLSMLRVAYCELRRDVPPSTRSRLPTIALLPCPEAP